MTGVQTCALPIFKDIEIQTDPSGSPPPPPPPPPSCTKVGDINCDGSVNISDLSVLLSRWNSNDTTADLNKNGKVDIYDLGILLSNWGT